MQESIVSIDMLFQCKVLILSCGLHMFSHFGGGITFQQLFSHVAKAMEYQQSIMRERNHRSTLSL